MPGEQNSIIVQPLVFLTKQNRSKSCYQTTWKVIWVYQGKTVHWEKEIKWLELGVLCITNAFEESCIRKIIGWNKWAISGSCIFVVTFYLLTICFFNKLDILQFDSLWQHPVWWQFCSSTYSKNSYFIYWSIKLKTHTLESGFIIGLFLTYVSMVLGAMFYSKSQI